MEKNDELKCAFQALCSDYEDLLDETAQFTQPVDERIGLALFKINEACAAADVLCQEAQQVQEQLLSEILSNCHELEDLYLRVNLIERFVGRVLQTTRELEKRTESISRIAGPIFNPSTSVTNLLRSLSNKRGSQEDASNSKWTPVLYEFNTKELLGRLEKIDARELGISISSCLPTKPIEQKVSTDVDYHGLQQIELIDACGSLTSNGARLLEQEMHDERLAIVLFLGLPSTRTIRQEFVAKLLGIDEKKDADSSNDALVLLAKVTYVEEEFNALILDVSTSDTESGSEQLIGAFCAVSSLVVSCYEETEFIPCIASSLPQFQSLFQTLMRDFMTMEVFEMLPKMINVDLSSCCVHEDKLADAERNEKSSSVETLENLIRFKQVRMVYTQSIDLMKYDDFCKSHAAVKRLFGIEMSGEMLAALLRKLSLQMCQQEPLDFGTAWDDFVEDKCHFLAEDALSTYMDCVHPAVLEHPPMELNAFTQLHEEIWRLSMDVYYSASKYKSTRYQTVRYKLKADIGAQYDAELSILTQKSREFCEELKRILWTELYSHATQLHDGNTFFAILTAIQNFDKQYSEKARGPEKISVLCEFYQREAIDAFRQLENFVTQQVSESRLEEWRHQLENEFADKKKCLVKHFKQEEAQLRARMARDIETMQKMHESKSARVKIECTEVKWLRDEIDELKRQNRELQEKAIVCEHTQQETSNQKAVLATKVNELEAAMRREMVNRTEIVDTLALTIKNAEKKEKELSEKNVEQQLELKEKTFRIEGKLQDLAHQLQKTTEEKEELQKKLNEFFLKVTALPEGLQQHFFCMENDQVDFAGAFTSFMSQ